MKTPEALGESFYFELTAFRDARGVSERTNYVEVPDSWHVVMADVKGSTKAIQAGKYKDVNMVGAAAIAAVCNAWDRRYLPYVFGGDGATFLVPESQLTLVLEVLTSVATMSMREFALELRVGAVSMRELQAAGSSLKIAKQALSSKISQAIFSGGGLNHAEKIIKARHQPTTMTASDQIANYDGLECRWQPIKSRDGEIMSVLILVKDASEAEAFRIYFEIIEEIELLTGGTQGANPARKNSLSVSSNARKLMSEIKVKRSSATWLERARSLFGLTLATLFGKVAFAFKLKSGGVDWGGYKNEVVQNSDFWKFDDMLRFVLDVSAVQKRALMACLENHYKHGDIYYGVHSSPSALMTCLIFDRQGEHIHFMDGNDGGYALAAVGLKQQMSLG